MRTRKVKLSDIKIDEDNFQQRDPDALGFAAPLQRGRSAKHTVEIIDGLKRGEKPLPLDLWEDAEGTLWLIDGHHRFEAYCEVYGAKMSTKVAASVHEGISKAYAQNKHGKLSMHKSEKLQYAWKSLCSDDSHFDQSLRKLEEELGVSKSTLGTMKKLKEKLIDDERLEEFPQWCNAQSAFRGYERGEEGDGWHDKQLEIVKNRFLRALRAHHGDGELQMVTEGISAAMTEMYGVTFAIDIDSYTSSDYSDIDGDEEVPDF